MSEDSQPGSLILMRHAKSDWSDGSLTDHDRPLNRRGKRDAPRMAKWLAAMHCIPELLLCSSSTRTKETASLMMDAWDTTPEIEFSRDLYHASPDAILDAVKSMAKDQTKLMVLAHNPGMAYLVSTLAGESMDMPTAAIGIFSVSCAWYELTPKSSVRMTEFMRPKALED